MRRHIVAVATAVALATPVANAAAAIQAAQKSTAKKKVVTAKYVGAVEQADRWGTVQVTVTVQTTTVGVKKTRRYTDLGGSYTFHTGRSQFLMSSALPQLRSEFLSSQTPNVQMVSGASYTSQAFEQSLQSALAKIK